MQITFDFVDFVFSGSEKTLRHKLFDVKGIKKVFVIQTLLNKKNKLKITF
jgi:hypothetical protein